MADQTSHSRVYHVGLHLVIVVYTTPRSDYWQSVRVLEPNDVYHVVAWFQLNVSGQTCAAKPECVTIPLDLHVVFSLCTQYSSPVHYRYGNASRTKRALWEV